MVESNSGELELQNLVIDMPISHRADLTELGIEELDRGVCEDTFDNRRILRKSKLIWESVYTTDGTSSGLLKVRSADSVRERRIQSLSEKRPLLSVQTDNNSDYITGYDLMAEEATDYLVPPWVMNATRLYLKEQEEGYNNPKRAPLAQPHRCRQIKDDGIRCMLWSSGRPKDDGLCRVHLRSLKHKTSDDIEKAREKLTQAAPFAVDKLEELMEYAESEPVALKAATEILDRAGVRGGYEVDTNATLDVRPAADVIQERLERLAAGAAATAATLNEKIIDAEVVSDQDGEQETVSTFLPETDETEERPALSTNKEEE